MAFGMMQAKWGILNRPVSVKLSNLTFMAQAIARLHNFCINERLREGGSEEEFEASVNGYMPTVPHDEHGDPVELSELFKGTIEGHSHLRESMARTVKAWTMERPFANRRIKRRKVVKDI